MSRNVVLASLLLSLSLAACYRTHYVNLQPPGTESPAAAVTKSEVSGWQHFFLWGWFPRERVMEADKVCGPTAQVREIQTQQTFLQGLVAILASYYVNIYSPYDAQVFCAPPATIQPVPRETVSSVSGG